MQYQEDNNYPKAILFTFLLVGILWLTFYFIVFKQPIKQEDVGIGGIVVNYGTADVGMGNNYMQADEPSIHPHANHDLSNRITVNKEPLKHSSAETTDQNIVTQDLEDAPAFNSKDGKTRPAISTHTPTKNNQPAPNPNALYKGASNGGQGNGDGTGSTVGNQGSRSGDPLSSNYGQGGSGSGNVSLSLVNRVFVSTPTIEDQGQSAGKIVVEIRVDKMGNVVFARAGAKGTTLSDLALWHKCEVAASGTKLNQLDAAPDIQSGTIIFNFRVK